MKAAECEEVRVHIVLKEAVRKDAARRDQAVKAIIDVSGLRDLNEKRLHRYGIISGLVRRECLSLLQALSGMESVSEDSQVHTL